MSDTEIARRGPRVLYQMRTSANSAFQLKRKSEQLRIPTQMRACELRVQRETRIFAITDHELSQLHPIFSPHNGE